MTFSPQETEFLVSLLRQVNVNAANPHAQQTIALTQALLTKLQPLPGQDGAAPIPGPGRGPAYDRDRDNPLVGERKKTMTAPLQRERSI